MVRGTVEETLNALLDAKADELCNVQRYERSPDRVDTRAGYHTRKMHAKAGELKLKMLILRKQTFEMTSIERYRRRDISIKEAIIQIYPGRRICAMRGGYHRSPLGYPGFLGYGL